MEKFINGWQLTVITKLIHLCCLRERSEITYGEGGLRFSYGVWFFRVGNHSNVVTQGGGGLKIPFFALRNFRTFHNMEKRAQESKSHKIFSEKIQI